MMFPILRKGGNTGMERQFRFGYGEGTVPLTVRAQQVEVLKSVTPPPITDLREAFRAAVEEDVIGGKPLNGAITAADQVTVIISDLTRAWMHQERICPLLLDYLHDVVGVPDEQIIFLVALGTHRPQTKAELVRLVSAQVLARVRVVNHDWPKAASPRRYRRLWLAQTAA